MSITLPSRSMTVPRRRATRPRQMADPVPLTGLLAWSTRPVSRLGALGTRLGAILWTDAVPPSQALRLCHYDPVVDRANDNLVVGELQVLPVRPMLRHGSDAGRRVQLTPAGAWLCRDGGRTPLDLPELWIDSATPVGRVWGHRKARNRPWELVVSGPASSFLVRGPWVLLAYLGTLAGWPEPC